MSQDRKNRIWIGLGLLAAAIVGIYLLGSSGGDAGCEVTAAGAATVAEGVLHGEGPKAILGAAGTAVASGMACQTAVEKLVEQPEEQVELEVSTPTGEGATVQTSGDEVLEAAPEPVGSLGRAFDCSLSYGNSEFLYSMCADGLIEP
jgi:hypothetical protein